MAKGGERRIFQKCLEAKHELFSDEESMKKEEKIGMELLLSAGQCVGEEQEVESDEDEN